MARSMSARPAFRCLSCARRTPTHLLRPVHRPLARYADIQIALMIVGSMLDAPWHRNCRYRRDQRHL
jgi:hypothetical protein